MSRPDTDFEVSYDSEDGAVYIRVPRSTPPSGGEAEHTIPLDMDDIGGGMINLDFDADGKLLGIEILDAEHRLDAAVLRHAAKSR